MSKVDIGSLVLSILILLLYTRIFLLNDSKEEEIVEKPKKKVIKYKTEKFNIKRIKIKITFINKKVFKMWYYGRIHQRVYSGYNYVTGQEKPPTVEAVQIVDALTNASFYIKEPSSFSTIETTVGVGGYINKIFSDDIKNPKISISGELNKGIIQLEIIGKQEDYMENLNVAYIEEE